MPGIRSHLNLNLSLINSGGIAGLDHIFNFRLREKERAVPTVVKQLNGLSDKAFLQPTGYDTFQSK
jgi:hypothetical protein